MLRFFSSKCRLFHNSTFFGFCVIHILYTECAKIKKKKIQRQRVNLEADTLKIVILPQLNKIAPIPEAYMVDTEETPQNIEGGPDAPEPAVEGDIQMENSSDLLCNTNIGTEKINTHKNSFC